MSSLVAFIRLSRSDILTNYKSFKMKLLMTCYENKPMVNYYESFGFILSMETFSPKWGFIFLSARRISGSINIEWIDSCSLSAREVLVFSRCIPQPCPLERDLFDFDWLIIASLRLVPCPTCIHICYPDSLLRAVPSRAESLLRGRFWRRWCVERQDRESASDPANH